METKRDVTKIRFSAGEIGWAELLERSQLGGGMLARVLNIPMCDDFNYDDIVELAENGVDLRSVKRVIARRFARKCKVYYDEVWQFHAFVALMRVLSCEAEGGVAPEAGRRGFLFAAYNPPFDPAMIAEGMGILRPRSPS